MALENLIKFALAYGGEVVQLTDVVVTVRTSEQNCIDMISFA